MSELPMLDALLRYHAEQVAAEDGVLLEHVVINDSWLLPETLPEIDGAVVRIERTHIQVKGGPVRVYTLYQLDNQKRYISHLCAIEAILDTGEAT